MQANFLARSLKYYSTTVNSYTHPLDLYAALYPMGIRELPHTAYTHPTELELKILGHMMQRLIRPLSRFDTRSIAWTLSKFPTQVLECTLERLSMKANEATISTLPSDIVNRLTMSLASLEAALLAKDPMMPQHLKQSHALLISYPETVHLLDDTEIARLISAAQIHANIEIVKAAVPRTGGRKKASADDL